MGQNSNKKLIRRKRFKKSQMRDYIFFLKNKDKFNFCGVDIPLPEEGEYEVEDCFILWDTKGELHPCKDPELLREIMMCKKSINFHIKLWVDGYNDMFMGVDEYLNEMIDPPEWVSKSFRGQLKKKFYEEYLNNKYGLTRFKL